MPRKGSTNRNQPPRRSRQNTVRPDPPTDHNHGRSQEVQDRRDIRSTHASQPPPESPRRGRHGGRRRSSSLDYSYSDEASNDQDEHYLSELSDQEENGEDVPLFSSSNFNSATDNADYRAAKRVQRFDIVDDVDFENYHDHDVDKCYKLGRNASLFALSFSLLMCIIKRDKLASYLGFTSNQRKEPQEHQGHQIRAPSSRWGARFDDDDNLQFDDDDFRLTGIGGSNTPKYHQHGHKHAKKALSEEEKELELEKWEEFESDQAHVLSNSAAGWDIYRKPEKSDEAAKGHHWVRYLDPKTNLHYYYLRETNSTQWEKPVLEHDDILLGIIDGREIVIEDGHAEEVTVDEDTVTEPTSQIDKSGAHSVRASNLTGFDTNGLLSHYKDSLLRWNHVRKRHYSGSRIFLGTGVRLTCDCFSLALQTARPR